MVAFLFSPRNYKSKMQVNIFVIRENVDITFPKEFNNIVNCNYSFWRDIHMKRTGGLVPAWRSIPKSHSSSILEVEPTSSNGSWATSPRAFGNGKIKFSVVVVL